MLPDPQVSHPNPKTDPNLKQLESTGPESYPQRKNCCQSDQARNVE